MTNSSSAQSPAYQDARKQIIGWGACMAVIYLIYLIVFPLIPAIYDSKSTLDIEMILKRDNERWFIWVYMLGLAVLFYGYWRVLSIIHALSQSEPESARALRKPILIIGIVSGVILLGLYPISALDVVLYVVRSRLWVLYNANPLTTLPAHYTQDPYIGLGGEFQNMPSPYGPLFELLARVAAQLGFLDIAGGVIAMKMLSLISYTGTGYLIGWHSEQESERFGVSQVTALGFFALSPLVLLEALGNGHNDMLMLFFITWALILWHKDRWAWAAVMLTLASLVKLTGILLLPIFGLSILLRATDWKTRFLRGLGLLAVFGIISAGFYLSFGPFTKVLQGARDAALNRQGFSPAYMLYVLINVFFTRYNYRVLPLMKELLAVYYVYVLIVMWWKKLTFNEASFLIFLGEIMLGTAFRIWYPLWLFPFAALNLNSKTFWRTFLFSITAEFSILSYYVLWRWAWVNWTWGKKVFGRYWEYWTIMTPFTVSWTFIIPFMADWLKRRKDHERFDNSLWL